MTVNTPPPPPPPPPPPDGTMSVQEARAEAKAAKAHAKAHAKAMRPWYRKKRWWVLGGVAIIIAISAAASAGGKTKTTTTTSAVTPGASATTVSKGAGSQDASADVVLGQLNAPHQYSSFQDVDMQITNHSSKRSNYFIDISAESADGKTQYASTSAFANNVEPGQSATANALFTKSLPADTVVKIKSVQRTAA